MAIAVAGSLALVTQAPSTTAGLAALFFSAVAAMALPAARSTHGHARFGPANLVTTLRAALVSVVAATLLLPATPEIALATATLGTLAVTLDGVDGQLARRSGLASPFGARFDMEVDALLILALCLLAWRHGRAGAWVLLAGLLRYLFVGAGWWLRWMQRPLEPSRRRQASCVIQIAALLIVLTPWIGPPWTAIIAAASVATLCYSFLVDVRWLWLNAGD